MPQSRANSRSQDEWFQLIQECRSSGLSDRTWCEQHGILVSSFYNAVKRLRKSACDIPHASNRRTYALDITSASKQEAVRIDICPEHYPEEVSSAKQMCPVPHLDNSHTIEIMMDDVSLKVSNSADPFLLQQIIRMLKTDPC